MPIFLLNFFSKPANIIATILISIIIGLGIYNIVLKQEVKNRDNTIAEQKVNLVTLKLNVTNLTNSINEQNTAIDNMNKEQLKAKEDFDKKYSNLQSSQKPIIKYIEKESQYVSPIGVSECDATKMVISDFIKNRNTK